MLGGIVQTEKARRMMMMMMMIDAELQMTRTPSTGVLLILLCTHCVPAHLKSWLNMTTPNTIEKCHTFSGAEQ